MDHSRKPETAVTSYCSLLFILAAAFLWATIGPVARFALRSGIDPLEISFWRAAIAGALFAAHAIARRRTAVARADLPAVVAFAIVGITLFYWSFFRAVQAGGAALAAILLYTAPAWVAVAAALWLGERITPRKALAVALTLAGVVLVALGSGSPDGAGVAVTPGAVTWGLVAGFAYAAHYLFGKRYFPRYDAATLFAWAVPLGALMLLPLVPFAPKSPADWAVLLFIAVVPTYVSYLLYGIGLRRIEATRAATVATLEPVAAALLAFLVWGEALRGAAYAGAALVLLGVLVVSSDKIRRGGG